MSSFEDIKVGDRVLISRSVTMGWSTSRSYWVRAKVLKVTPKQFAVDGHKFKKLDGSLIGGYGRVEVIGETIDQTEEFIKLRTLVSKVSKIKRLSEKSFDYKVMSVEDADLMIEILSRSLKKEKDQ